MPLHDALGVNCRRTHLMKIKGQMPSIWGKVHKAVVSAHCRCQQVVLVGCRGSGSQCIASFNR